MTFKFTTTVWFICFPIKSKYNNIEHRQIYWQKQNEQDMSLSYNNVFFIVLLLILSRNCIHHIVWTDLKSASVLYVNRKLWDINPFRSRCFFSLAFIVTQHYSLYRCFNGLFKCILLFWKSRFHLRQRGGEGNLFLWTIHEKFRCLSPF